MNFESFEQELQKLDASPATNKTSKVEAADATTLAVLRSELQSISASVERSDAHQAWAWTRLQARLREKEKTSPSHAPLLLKWLVPGAITLLVAGFWFFNNDGASELTPLDSGIYASSFHLPGSRADVLWIVGYESESATGNMP